MTAMPVAVIDPHRDINRILARLTERDLRLTHVFETLVHKMEEVRLSTGSTLRLCRAEPRVQPTGPSDGSGWWAGWSGG